MKIELNKKEIDILLKGLLELNHRLINDLVKTTTTADCEQVKNRIIDLNFLIDKIHIEDLEKLNSEAKEWSAL